jgi:hypothetical protein
VTSHVQTAGTARARAGWGASLTAAAVLAVGGIVSYGYGAAADAHVAAEWAKCHDLPVSWQMYGTAYGALVCSLAAVLLAARRLRQPPTRGPALLAGLSLTVGVLLLLLQTLIVWWLYQPSPGGPISCTG